MTVTGTDADGDPITPATDTHSLDIGFAPVLDVTKSGPATADVGDTVTYAFAVTNDNVAGDGSPITITSVTDDVAGAATYQSGDDGDNLLEVGETWTYQATYTIQATDPDPLTNTVTATGTDQDGDPVPDATDTHSTDVGYAPALDVVKSGPAMAAVGETVTYTFAITNDNVAGDGSPVTITGVTDDVAGAATYQSGDDGDNLLEVGETWTYQATHTITLSDPDPLTNTVTATGTDQDGDPVPDATDAHVTDLINPSIAISKTPDLQTVVTGGTATFTVTVTNTGDSTLAGITVTDPLAPDCDRSLGDFGPGASITYTCTLSGVAADFTNTATTAGTDLLGNPVTDSDTADVTVLIPTIDIQKTPDLQTIALNGDATFTITVTNTGPVDLTNVAVADPLAPTCDSTIGDLAAGASTSYACTLAGVTADFTNTATVTGDDPLGNPVSDSDDAVVDVIAPAIEIQKTPDVQNAVSGADATFTISVINSGDTNLTNVVVSDPLVPACDATIGDLAAGASTSYVCSLAGVTADFTNTATATGSDLLGNPVTDTDTAQVNVLIGSIEIQKTPDSQLVPYGGDADFTIAVTNTGPIDLTNVTVTDPLAPACDNAIGDLPSGTTVTYGCTMPGVLADVTNVATVNANDTAGNPYTGTDDADVTIVTPVVEIEKTPDLQTILTGGDATFTITVSNNGDVDLSNVAVSDPLAPNCDNAIGDLTAGASTSYACTLTGVAADFTNTATVTAEDPFGNPLTDSDTADIDVIDPGVEIQKTPDTQTILSGDDAHVHHHRDQHRRCTTHRRDGHRSARF